VHGLERACAGVNPLSLQVVSANHIATFLVCEAIPHFNLSSHSFCRLHRASRGVGHHIGYSPIVSKNGPAQVAYLSNPCSYWDGSEKRYVVFRELRNL